MQPERQVSIALIAVGGALVIPQYVALSHHPGITPGASLAVGGILGALGVSLGSLLVCDHPARSARVLGLAILTLVGLAFSVGVYPGVVHSVTWGSRIVFGLVVLLPILGPVALAARAEKG